ncbi:c-type cytochrome [Rhodospirillaceae bacterium SYSU D60014]|uniref:c-type cytochrome n=1 Tax=Virgifigura deserti TaxID=2268457 RepID=UPI000E664BB8
MPPFEPRRTALIAALSLCLAIPAGAQESRFGFGEPANPEQIAGWDIDARTPGVGLPEGSGSVADGREVYVQVCMACHGEEGQGPMDRLVGGVGTLDTDKPAKTVGSYWPYAATLFDYIHRAMPFDRPQSLTPDEVYAATAFVLYMNELVPEDAVMNAETLPKVEMRNRDGFYGPDPRPDVHNWPCMRNCEPLSPEVGEVEVPTQSEIQ